MILIHMHGLVSCLFFYYISEIIMNSSVYICMYVYLNVLKNMSKQCCKFLVVILKAKLLSWPVLTRKNILDYDITHEHT